jgi:SNF family Na+-dependent transporter
MLGCLAGYGSFWRFSYLFYVNGGSVFLIPYFLFMVFLGAPVLHIENVLGQFGQTTSIRLYERLHPRLKGLGTFPLVVAFFLSAYYNSILVYSWAFFFSSFQSPLPWTLEKQPGDILNERYFKEKVLHLTGSAGELGDFQPYLFGLYIFSIVLCTLAIIKGVKVSGKITLVTATLPYLLLAVLLVRGLFLQGAGAALR